VYPDVRNSDDLYRPTGVRPAIVIAAAKAGKHVLSEKPIAPTAVEAALMLQACRDANVVFMDGVMFMHNPRLSAIKEKTESEDFGDLKRVVGDFSFAGDAGFFKDNIRVNKKLEPLGCLGDLGVYNIRLAMFAYDWKKPATVSAVGHTMIDGVPIDMSTTLGFGDGRSASFTNSFASAFRQTANFVGTKQALDFDDFTLAGVESNSCGFNLWKEHGLTENALLVTKDIEQVKVEYEYPQEVAMWVKFKELAEGSLEDTAAERNFYADVSLDTQKVLDAAMQSAAQEGAAVKVAD